jgi:hypothetical protein
MYWKPRQEAIRRASRVYKGENKRQKIEVQCSECQGWFMAKEVEADHITPAGSCRTFEELGQFAERLFCEADGYQILCKPCHQEKTNKTRK